MGTMYHKKNMHGFQKFFCNKINLLVTFIFLGTLELLFYVLKQGILLRIVHKLPLYRVQFGRDFAFSWLQPAG